VLDLVSSVAGGEWGSSRLGGICSSNPQKSRSALPLEFPDDKYIFFVFCFFSPTMLRSIVSSYGVDFSVQGFDAEKRNSLCFYGRQHSFDSQSQVAENIQLSHE